MYFNLKSASKKLKSRLCIKNMIVINVSIIEPLDCGWYS